MNKEDFTTTYFLTRPLFLGSILAPIISPTKSDAIICFILGNIIGIFFIYLLNKAKLDNKFYKLLKIILYILFIVISTYTIEIFINDFFLLETPKGIIIATSIILCLYASKKDYKVIKYTSVILFILSIFTLGITFISLLNYIKLGSLTPFFTSKITPILKGSLIYASLSTIPHILINDDKLPLKKHIKCYLFSSLICSIVGFLELSVLTPEVAKIYRFPEYILLKRIRLFNFIENFENILSTIWYLDYFIFLTLTFKNLNKELNNNILFYSIIILTPILTNIFLVNKYYPILILHKYLWLIAFIFILIIGFNPIKKLFISSERHK